MRVERLFTTIHSWMDTQANTHYRGVSSSLFPARPEWLSQLLPAQTQEQHNLETFTAWIHSPDWRIFGEQDICHEEFH